MAHARSLFFYARWHWSLWCRAGAGFVALHVRIVTCRRWAACVSDMSPGPEADEFCCLAAWTEPGLRRRGLRRSWSVPMFGVSSRVVHEQSLEVTISLGTVRGAPVSGRHESPRGARFEGLPHSWVQAGSECAVLKQAPGDVVGEAEEAEGGAAEVFELAVDCLCGAVAGAGRTDVRQCEPQRRIRRLADSTSRLAAEGCC